MRKVRRMGLGLAIANVLRCRSHCGRSGWRSEPRAGVHLRYAADWTIYRYFRSPKGEHKWLTRKNSVVDDAPSIRKFGDHAGSGWIPRFETVDVRFRRHREDSSWRPPAIPHSGRADASPECLETLTVDRSTIHSMCMYPVPMKWAPSVEASASARRSTDQTFRKGELDVAC